MTLLIAGIAGGVALSDRQDQQRTTAADLTSAQAGAPLQPAGEVLNVPGQQVNEHNAASQQNAQTKADSAATAASAQAKSADNAERQNQAANRSTTRPTTDGPASGGSAGPIPSSCSAYSGNRATGCAVMLQWGFTIDQAPCLMSLWNRESNWRTSAANPSGAYGIPQAKPGSKMAVYGADWKTNAVTQIKWGLDYIKGRYKNPCGAWGHSQSTGWY